MIKSLKPLAFKIKLLPNAWIATLEQKNSLLWWVAEADYNKQCYKQELARIPCKMHAGAIH